MNKADFISELSEILNIPCCRAKKYTEAMIEVLSRSLCRKEPIQFFGFGTLEVRMSPERVARNPQTKEPVVIPERYRTVFRSSPKLLEKINSGGNTEE